MTSKIREFLPKYCSTFDLCCIALDSAINPIEPKNADRKKQSGLSPNNTIDKLLSELTKLATKDKARSKPDTLYFIHVFVSENIRTPPSPF